MPMAEPLFVAYIAAIAALCDPGSCKVPGKTGDLNPAEG